MKSSKFTARAQNSGVRTHAQIISPQPTGAIETQQTCQSAQLSTDKTLIGKPFASNRQGLTKVTSADEKVTLRSSKPELVCNSGCTGFDELLREIDVWLADHRDFELSTHLSRKHSSLQGKK